MICSRLVCTTVLCLASTGLCARGADHPSPPRTTQQQSNHDVSAWQAQRLRQETNARRLDNRKARDWDPNLGWSQRVGKARPDQVWSISEARENLAREWQRLGIPANKAVVIAAAYDARPARHHSMRGQSKQDIASQLQKAVKSGHYRLANQLLIDYQHDNLKQASDQ